MVRYALFLNTQKVPQFFSADGAVVHVREVPAQFVARRIGHTFQSVCDIVDWVRAQGCPSVSWEFVTGGTKVRFDW
jgi:hypothetical protein